MRSIREIFRSYAVFNAQGRHVNGTDKQSNHNYGDAYESLFCKPEMYEVEGLPLPGLRARSTRESVKLMMEVGVADGSCLLAWREVFPNATIVGMDIHPSEKAHGERIEFHIGDQRSLKDCRQAVGDRFFDLIVEDATHQLGDSLQTLFYLWPFVRPGGLYVIEEFDNVVATRGCIVELWPTAKIIDTVGPSGGNEPLVVLRKPL